MSVRSGALPIEQNKCTVLSHIIECSTVHYEFYAKFQVFLTHLYPNEANFSIMSIYFGYTKAIKDQYTLQNSVYIRFL